MLDLSERMLPPALAGPSGNLPATLGAGSTFALASGSIAGHMRAVGLDRRRKVATYELLVANETHAQLHGIAYERGRSRSDRSLTWCSITVPARTSVAVPIEIPFEKNLPPRSVVADLYAGGAHLTIDAEPLEIPSGRARTFAFAAAATAVCSLLAGGYAFERPQVAALAAPSKAATGTPIEVAYALGGNVESARYTIATPQGREIRSGSLDPHGSSFSVALPRSGGYDVRVVAKNRLGSALRSTHVVAFAPSRETPPAAAFALAAGVVDGGSPIELRYSAAVGAGVAKLLDQDGTERGQALLSARGSSIVIAPLVERNQDFRLSVVAHNGERVTETQLPVRVRHVDRHARPQPGSSLPPVTIAAQPPQPRGANTDIVALARDSVRSGEPILVNITRFVPHLRVALINESGEEITAADVSPLENQMSFAAPAVSEPTHLSIVATFARGNTQESIIRPLLIRPH
ncbi:MAG: hypothetical protein GIW95_12675 [Candidatus Eremiobacteraeota bacterium]|nr:hypothetical protein [Candidatus Eremiobacteraeota bacterium]